jgi:predicted transcriptional regulator
MTRFQIQKIVTYQSRIVKRGLECSISESFLATYVTLEYGLDRRIDEVEVEDTFPMVGRNTAASTMADILKTKQAVLVVEKGKAIEELRRMQLFWRTDSFRNHAEN